MPFFRFVESLPTADAPAAECDGRVVAPDIVDDRRYLLPDGRWSIPVLAIGTRAFTLPTAHAAKLIGWRVDLMRRLARHGLIPAVHRECGGAFIRPADVARIHSGELLLPWKTNQTGRVFRLPLSTGEVAEIRIGADCPALW